MRPSSSDLLDRAAQVREQVGLEVLDVLEHVLHALAAQDVRQARPAGLVEVDVHDVRVAEQVVHVAQDLLVRADQEEAEVVGLVLLQRVQLERALDVAQVDEAVDLAVRVAGDVGQDRAPRRLLDRGGAAAAPGRAGGSPSESGTDWNSEKFRKYVSAMSRSRLREVVGHVVEACA